MLKIIRESNLLFLEVNLKWSFMSFSLLNVLLLVATLTETVKANRHILLTIRIIYFNSSLLKKIMETFLDEFFVIESLYNT